VRHKDPDEDLPQVGLLQGAAQSPEVVENHRAPVLTAPVQALGQGHQHWAVEQRRQQDQQSELVQRGRWELQQGQERERLRPAS
jgi:hypothetical protein